MHCRWVWAAVLALIVAGCGGSSEPPPKPKPTPRATPAPRTDVASVAARAGIPVLCYHQIRKQTAADSAQDRAYIVSPKVFAAQMRALDEAGYTTITGDALVDHVARGAKLPRKPILLTFDDASAGQYTQVLPVLREHNFVATFFVMTVVLGKPGWLTRGQVRALDRAGMTIGAHTYDHKSVPEYARRRLEHAVRRARPRAAQARRPPDPAVRVSLRRLLRRGDPAPVRGRLSRRLPARGEARPQAPAVEHPPDHRARAQRQAAAARDPQRLLGPGPAPSRPAGAASRRSNQVAPASGEPKTSPDVAPK